MSDNQQNRQMNVKLCIASMILVLVLLVGNAVFTGLAQWVCLAVVGVAIIGCVGRVVANLQADRR
ncbi:hypothetical protein ABZ419_03720 [Streptomyces cinnamoneus]|uniref:hypothetical protein n=1 Tax=Streptomyces cinnamoneus TaxID=53446 RepID=UPI00340FFDEA